MVSCLLTRTTPTGVAYHMTQHYRGGTGVTEQGAKDTAATSAAHAMPGWTVVLVNAMEVPLVDLRRVLGPDPFAELHPNIETTARVLH